MTKIGHTALLTPQMCVVSLWLVFLGGICGLMAGPFCPLLRFMFQMAEGQPSRSTDVPSQRSEPTAPRAVLLSNLLRRILGLFAALLWLGCILSIKWSKALHSAFPLSHPA